MSKNVVISGVVVLVLVVLGYFLTRPKTTVVPAPETTTQVPTESATPVASSEAMMAENRVSITVGGYNPKDITVKVGDTVTWKNTDSENHTVHSAPHPTHTAYPSLNLGLIKSGEEKSLQFSTAGTYKYHDHLNPSLTGSVTVQ